MSIVSILVVIISFLIIFCAKEKEYKMFLFVIALSLYTNLGTFTTLIDFDSFTREYFVLILLICLKLLKKNVHINTTSILAFSLIIMIIFFGFVNLMINPHMADIAPMTLTYDEIVINDLGLSKPTFAGNNIAAFLLFFIFSIAMILCKEYFYEAEYVDRTIDFIIKSLKIFFIGIMLEYIIINIFSGVNFREYIIPLFTSSEGSKIYTFSTARFFGLKSAFLFYSEPSYVSGPLLVFYLINYVRGNVSNKTLIWFLISFFVAIASGSTNCIIMIFLGIFTISKMVLKNKGIKNKDRVMKIFLLVMAFLFIFIFLVTNYSSIEKYFNKVYEKLLAYITLTQTRNSSTISGYIRRYGNQVCYSVLKTNPIIGVGLGTTRGYGFIPSMLATFGIVGSIFLLNFYKNVLNIKITKNNFILFIAVVGILTAFYSSSHMYSFILIPILISFNKLINE